MVKIQIIFDLDNTCAMSDVAMLDFYNEVTGNNIPYQKELVTWNMERLIKDWSKEQVNDIFIQEGFFKRLKLYDGVIETLNKLKADNHCIEIVSCHDIRGIHLKCEWIRKNLPMVDRINIIPLGEDLKLDKSHVEGDIIVDDVVSVLDTNPCRYKILFGDYHWNKDNNTYIRAENWQELYKIIKAIDVFENRDR